MHKHTHRHTLTGVHTLHTCMYVNNTLLYNLLISLHMQFGNNALLMASYGGSVEVVRMLLEEYNSSLDKVNNVSVYIMHYILP